MRRRLGIDSAAPVAVCTARMVRRKGQDTLVRVWPEVLRRDGAMVFVLDVPRLFSVEERDALRDVGRVVETMGSANPSAA